MLDKKGLKKNVLQNFDGSKNFFFDELGNELPKRFFFCFFFCFIDIAVIVLIVVVLVLQSKSRYNMDKL